MGIRTLSICSGIGGLDLAAEQAGFEPVAFVEIDPFCQRVLAARWPGVPILGDLATVTPDVLIERGVTDVDAIIGGIPCQPFSHAGKRQGADDHRHLWPEAFRLITALRPRWVVVENVRGFVQAALSLVSDDLGAAGYNVGAYLLPASAVGAPHERKRIFVVGRRMGDSHGLREPQQSGDIGQGR